VSSGSGAMLADLLTEPGHGARLAFSDELTIYGAATLQPRLQEVLSGGQDIELDLSAVSEIDCAGVQLLLLLERECQALNRGMRITAHSAATEEVFTLLNLPRFLATTTAH